MLALISALKDYGYEVNLDDVSPCHGTTSAFTLNYLEKRNKAPTSKHHKDVYKAKQIYTSKIIERECKPIQRIIDVLELCKSLGKVGLVTNCGKDAAYDMIERSEIINYFDAIITAGDVPNKTKPHPWPYILGASKIGVSTIECLAVEDTDYGLISAVDARCRTMKINSFDELTTDKMIEELNRLRIRI